MATQSFFEKLANASKANNSLLCAGLDPEPRLIPDHRVVAFNRLIIAATAGLVCAYKPNLALYEAMGRRGIVALERTIDAIRESNPDIPIIGDAKRVDIGNCSLAYAAALFERYKFDAVTVNPYMGSDALQPFLERGDKGIFVLCRTSNPGGRDLQELMVMREGHSSAQPLYEVVAELAQTWNKNGNLGLVVGATYPQQIGRVREICPHMTFLIPGIGAQGGNLAATVHNAKNSDGSGFIINVSRQIMYAAHKSRGGLRTPKEAVEYMRQVARLIRGRINEYREGRLLANPEPKKPLAPQVGSLAR